MFIRSLISLLVTDFLALDREHCHHL